MFHRRNIERKIKIKNKKKEIEEETEVCIVFKQIDALKGKRPLQIIYFCTCGFVREEKLLLKTCLGFYVHIFLNIHISYETCMKISANFSFLFVT